MTKKPYIVGNPIWESEDFYGRRDLARDLLDRRYSCTYLVGNRRMGKTSLLYFLDNPKNRKQLFPGTDQSSLVSLLISVGEIDKISAAMISAVEDKATEEERLQGISLDPQGDVGDTLHTLAKTARQGGFEILLLWDEAEVLLGLKDAHLRHLRDMFNHPSLHVILTASKRLYRLNEKTSHWQISPFLFGFAVRYIPPLTESEARDLICQTQRKEQEQVKASQRVQNRIVKLTGSHPFLVQLLSDRLLTEAGKLRPVVDDDLAIDDLLAAAFQADYNALAPSERKILRYVSRRRQADIDELQGALNLSRNDLHNYLFGLKQLGYICSRSNGYLLANELLQRWLNSASVKETPAGMRDQESHKLAAQGEIISRRTDLENHIRTSYKLFRQYEASLPLYTDPVERTRCQNGITAQKDLIRSHLRELASLGGSLPDDIAELAKSLGCQGTTSIAG